jgi:hypothetical protein
VVVRQSEGGRAKRTSGGAPPKGRKLGELLTLSAARGGQPVPVEIRYDKPIWSGLSWAVGEIAGGGTLELRATSSEHAPVTLAVEALTVDYSAERSSFSAK